MKRLDLMANVAVLISSVALLGFLGNSVYESHHAPQSRVARTQALVGTTVQLTGVDFTQKDKTLLIAISETCHFCQESQPFYRQLAQTPSATANLVAVLPMPQHDAEKFVHTSISPSLQAVSAPLGAIGVTGTPTLLLVDRNGKVIKAWIRSGTDESRNRHSFATGR